MIAPTCEQLQNKLTNPADQYSGVTLAGMYVVEVSAHPAELSLDHLTEFVARVAADTGVQPLSDHLLLDLRRGGSEGFIAVRVADAAETVALAQISAANHESALEVIVHPSSRAAGELAVEPARLARDAAETAIDAFGRAGGGALTIWVNDDEVGTVLAEVSVEHGLALRRSLHEMRVTLPLGQHATVATRSFAPGTDDANWVLVNNRAFAGHGEQGGWTLDTFALRQLEPWFDADGFRIYEVDGQIAAFCWTKVHHLSHGEVIGEIYVIAVDPQFHGRGLGKQLTLAGLDFIAARGITTANLYVDGDNEAAVSLYRSLGFAIHRTRRAFGGQISSPPVLSLGVAQLARNHHDES